MGYGEGVCIDAIDGAVLCCSAYDLLSGLPDGSVGAVICEPPPIADEPQCYSVALEISRVLRPGGAFVTFGGPLIMSHWDNLAVASSLEWMAELAVLWQVGSPRTNNFGSLVTRVSWYSKPGARHTFNSGERRSIYSNVLVAQKIPATLRRHPTEKPVALANFLVSLLTREASHTRNEMADLVCDPYCGSGSTLVSAAICDRRWVGSDSNPIYASAAQMRVYHHEIEEVDDLYLWINGRLEKV